MPERQNDDSFDILIVADSDAVLFLVTDDDIEVEVEVVPPNSYSPRSAATTRCATFPLPPTCVCRGTRAASTGVVIRCRWRRPAAWLSSAPAIAATCQCLISRPPTEVRRGDREILLSEIGRLFACAWVRPLELLEVLEKSVGELGVETRQLLDVGDRFADHDNGDCFSQPLRPGSDRAALCARRASVASRICSID